MDKTLNTFSMYTGILKGEWVTGKEKHVHRTQIPSPLPVIIYRGITPELKKL
jgi:hypothetical protein